jgi:dTDP-4-amino-4,6-dideoxygalactose transaminase
MERNTISKILKEEKCYQEKYFDEKVYKITSFEKDINHIKYIYQAALSTSILQNIETKDYEKIIENLNQFKGGASHFVA